MKNDNQLNIVDESDNIIGQESRSIIHEKGLLHREIHVWLYTSRGEIIFQHRAKDKETYPDLLDATVGGHVEIGQTYEQAAITEVREETGLSITADDLEFVKFIRNKVHDTTTNRINNVIRAVYGYKYDGDIADLKIEKGKGTGFEIWPIDKILNISDEDRKKFIPAIFNEMFIDIFKYLCHGK